MHVSRSIKVILVCLALGPAARAEAADPALEMIDDFIARQEIDKQAEGWQFKLNRPPRLRFDTESTYYWLLNTNKGQIKIRLFHREAPMHVSSTIYLTRLGYYDDTIFHRAIREFMVQGGDPSGTGGGSPGYQMNGELRSKLKHDRRGQVSAANAGRGTDGSQFFITFAEAKNLDGKHTIFGEVVGGLRTLDKFESVARHKEEPKQTPYQKLIIRSARIMVN
jgi:cyclophilin family peptidyl-prolyl cis-trans isomerase